MAPKKIEPRTPEQIRERTIRAGMYPYFVVIRAIDTHVDHKFVVFAESGFEAIEKSRKFSNVSGSGRASTLTSAFMNNDVTEIISLP